MHFLVINIITETPLWLSVFCLLLGVFYSLILYYKSKIEIPKYFKIGIAVTRFIVVAFLAFLLLNPLLKSLVRTIEKPVIVIAQDNSESLVLNKDSAFYNAKYKEHLLSFAEKLKEKFEVQLYIFGEKISTKSNLNFTDKTTDISSVFDEVGNKYSNRNLGAFILATDGIFNKGENPAYSSFDFAAPLYTIALGDTTVRKDIIIKKVYHNQFAYLGNKFPVQIDVKADKCSNENTVIKILQDNSTLFSQKIEIKSNDFFQSFSFLIDATKKGIQRYKIIVENVKDEVSTTNNIKDFYVEVLDGKQKVLIVANATHPDIAAIKTSIDANMNFESELVYSDETNVEIEKYNLCILHQLPSNRVNSSTPLLKKIQNANISLWYIIGNASNLNDFNSLNAGLKIIPTSSKQSNPTPVVNNNFSLFTFSDENKKIIEKFPPLISPFANYKIGGNPYIFLNQKIGAVKTETPLFVFSVAEGRKTAILAGEGLWRWKIYNFKDAANHNSFNDMISKTIQFLSLNIDKSRFKVILKDSYLENEPILIDAENYNESFELVNENDVQITITDSDGKKYPFTFNKTSQAYFLNAGLLPVGKYQYIATVKNSEKELISKGDFMVEAIQVESVSLTANHNLLYTLAEKYNGSMYYANQLDKLYNDIVSRKDLFNVSYSENKFADFINLKWLFFLFISLISFEWFVRKYFGGY
jgi:hypothetical protein